MRLIFHRILVYLPSASPCMPVKLALVRSSHSPSQMNHLSELRNWCEVLKSGMQPLGLSSIFPLALQSAQWRSPRHKGSSSGGSCDANAGPPSLRPPATHTVSLVNLPSRQSTSLPQRKSRWSGWRSPTFPHNSIMSALDVS